MVLNKIFNVQIMKHLITCGVLLFLISVFRINTECSFSLSLFDFFCTYLSQTLNLFCCNLNFAITCMNKNTALAVLILSTYNIA